MAKYRIRVIGMIDIIGKPFFVTYVGMGMERKSFDRVYQVERRNWLGKWKKIDYFLRECDAHKCFDELVKSGSFNKENTLIIREE